MRGKIAATDSDTATLAVPREAAKAAGLADGEALHLFAPGHPLFVATRDERFGFLAGTLAQVSVAELFGFLFASIRSGTLTIDAAGVRRSLAFREGNVVQATSTDPADRLGPVLWRHRMLSLERLLELEPQVRPGVRLGKLLTDHGDLTPAQLYQGMQLQVREIALGLFALQDGLFAFVEGAPEAAVVKLPERSRDLVLAGMARADELQILARKVKPQAVFALVAGGRAPADAHAQAVARLLDGSRSVSLVAEVSRLGLVRTLKVLADFSQMGLLTAVTLPLPTPAPMAAVPAVVPAPAGPGDLHARIFARLAAGLHQAGLPAKALNSFFDHLPEGLAAIFAGARFDQAGAFPVGTVLANGARLAEGALGRVRALDALDTLVMFAVFELRNRMTPEAGKRLARDVEALQRGARP